MIHIALHSPQTKGRKYPIAGQGPAIMANGIGGAYDSQMSIEDDGVTEPVVTRTDKPPYKVPSMGDISAIPLNGYKVASLFSGCGGSSLGYRMAGFKVIYANEFVPAAQDTYRANHPETHLDCRDVRMVTPESILSIIGMERGELDVLDGSPPCQAFSSAGKREKGWGHAKEYEHGAKQCNETLFNDYIRILDGLQPRVFIAENVSGLVRGTAKGMFLEILAGLKACGYRVACRILDAQWLGVPQTRSRVIFIGVRNDIGLEPCYPRPLPYRYSVREAIPWIETAQSGPTGFGVGSQTPDTPAPAVSASMQAPYSGHTVTSRVIHDTAGQFAVNEDCTDVPCPAITCRGAYQFYVQSGARPKTYVDGSKPSPAGTDGRTTEVKSEAERRKFTIAELRRICSFPDDFVLTGSYAQQWERLGNSVPPVMMSHIATAVRDGILDKANAT